MTGRRVLVTGIGLVSALGNDLDSFGQRLMNADSGVRLIRREAAGRHIEVCAAEAQFDPAQHFNKMELVSLDRSSQMAVMAARQALQGAATDGGSATGVYMGCAMGGSTQIETTYRDLFVNHEARVRPVTIVNVMANAAAAHIALRYHLRGGNLTFSTACSSSALAIGEACRAIRHGYMDAVVAGGTEALLVFGSLHGWEALGTLAKPTADPRAACRPFSEDRTGLVLGEGAALLLLEEEQHALDRGATIYGEIAGYGNHCDASHLTRPNADGQAQAMRAALDDAGLAPAAIGYINAHGTATHAGDLSETLAIKSVFGTQIPPVSSTKASHGHTLGAAGALELIVCLCALRTQQLPPTLNLDRPDAACDLDYVAHRARPAPIAFALSNSFAFGGSNASLIVTAYPAPG